MSAPEIQAAHETVRSLQETLRRTSDAVLARWVEDARHDVIQARAIMVQPSFDVRERTDAEAGYTLRVIHADAEIAREALRRATERLAEVVAILQDGAQ